VPLSGTTESAGHFPEPAAISFAFSALSFSKKKRLKITIIIAIKAFKKEEALFALQLQEKHQVKPSARCAMRWLGGEKGRRVGCLCASTWAWRGRQTAKGVVG